MDKYIYDEKNGLCYELQGDYYLPCLKLSKEESSSKQNDRQGNLSAIFYRLYNKCWGNQIRACKKEKKKSKKVEHIW